MAGRKNHNVLVYDFNGEFIIGFNSISEFRKNYYSKDNGIRPIFNHKELGERYHIVYDLDLIAVENKIGRLKIKKILKIINSDFCKAEDNIKSKKSVVVYNLKGEIIAEFKTLRLLTKLMPHISQTTINNHLNKRHLMDENLKVDLIFKYKN